MRKSNTLLMKELGRNMMRSGVLTGLVAGDILSAKNINDTQMSQAFIINASSQGYEFNAGDDDMPERIMNSFIAATSVYLGKVKRTNPNEAVALVLTDVAGNFKFAGIVEYHENENKDEPGNWSYVLTFNEQDIVNIEKKKVINKHLYSDTQFKTVFDKVAHDIGGIAFQHESYMYTACLILVDTILQVLDKEAVAGEVVDIENVGYCTFSVEVDGDEKIFAITPSGKMKELIKGDTDLEK